MTTLQAYREANGILQKTLADELGIARSYLSEIETGQKSPGLALALRIVEKTGNAVTVESLATPSAKPSNVGGIDQ